MGWGTLPLPPCPLSLLWHPCPRYLLQLFLLFSGPLVSVPTLSAGSAELWAADRVCLKVGYQGLPSPGGSACPAAVWPQGGAGTRFFSFSAGAARIPSSPRARSFSGSAGRPPAAARGGSLPAGRPREREAAFAYPDPIPGVSPFSREVLPAVYPPFLLLLEGREQAEGATLLLLFLFFVRILPPSPRLELKYLFSSASPGL